MSYDLRLCLREEGRSPEEVARRDASSSSNVEAEDTPRIHHLATVLAAAFPRFIRTGDSHAIELSSSGDDSGLQVTLLPREAGVSLPYRAHADKGRAALGEMWRCAEILEREAGFFTYDPQLGRVLDLSKDFEAAMTAFADGTKRSQAMAPLPPSKRPLPIFPPELDRLPYLLRWLGISAAALALTYPIVRLTAATAAEVLALVPVVAWLAVKMLVLDPARLRAIGWSPTLTFISLFPPAGLFLQLLLFFLSSRLR